MPLALITGAARANSIAAGVAARLTETGWDVVATDLEGCDYACDLSTPDGPAQLIRAILADRGPIEALILSHAHDVETGILDTTAESFDRHIAVNARASLLLIAEFARQAPSDGGVIVAFTSDHTTGNLPYVASKGALDRIVISAAPELGPRRISANVINPGPIDTGWMNDDTRKELTGMPPWADSETRPISARSSRTSSAPRGAGYPASSSTPMEPSQRGTDCSAAIPQRSCAR